MNQELDASYTPIDVGFDLRRHPDVAIELPAGDHLRVRYMCGFEERVIEGTRADITHTLREAGYTVV